LSPLLESSRFSTSWSGLESDFSRLDQSAPVNPTTPAFDPSACCRRVRSGVNTLGTGSNPPPVSVSARKPLHLEQENALSARRHKQTSTPTALGSSQEPASGRVPTHTVMHSNFGAIPTMLPGSQGTSSRKQVQALSEHRASCHRVDRKDNADAVGLLTLLTLLCMYQPKHQPRARRESMSARTRIVARASLRKQHRASIDDSH
jgi:hypothetical protein